MEYPIYYVAHPWKFNPQQSFINAVSWTQELRKKGLMVFSPILHTHYYWKLLKMNKENNEYIKKEDWLDWDIKIIEGFMNGEGFIQFKCVKCGGIRDYPFNCCGKITQKQFYDSGVTILLSNTAYRRWIDFKVSDEKYSLLIDGTWHKFISKGCEKEYKFAKSHHIRVLELESFLEGKEVDL